jgi:hypothetical protein
MLPFRDDVQCYVEKLEYDFQRRAGKLFMGENSCTDMDGCIRLFKRIDPDVELIETIASPSSPRRDTTYRRVAGKWKAYLPGEAVQ